MIYGCEVVSKQLLVFNLTDKYYDTLSDKAYFYQTKKFVSLCNFLNELKQEMPPPPSPQESITFE